MGATVAFGRQKVFCALNIPTWFWEILFRISQCRDLSKFSTSLVVTESSRTINLPPGLTILSTSAITATILHLQRQHESHQLAHCKRGLQWLATSITSSSTGRKDDQHVEDRRSLGMY